MNEDDEHERMNMNVNMNNEHERMNTLVNEDEGLQNYHGSSSPAQSKAYLEPYASSRYHSDHLGPFVKLRMVFLSSEANKGPYVIF